MRKGFTLVELSIVLVIIGLLIGGILVAQSMIETARISGLIRQIEQFDAGIGNFHTKYNSAPGDSRVVTPAGNGDGVLEDSNIRAGTLAYATTFNLEISNFWYHLSVTGFQPEGVSYSNSAASGIRTGTHIPKTSFGRSTAPAGFLPYNMTALPRATYFIADFSNTTTALFNNNALFRPAFTPLQVLALDKKLDDGLAAKGFITSYNPTAGLCNSSDTYLTNSNKECSIFIEIAPKIGVFKNR